MPTRETLHGDVHLKSRFMIITFFQIILEDKNLLEKPIRLINIIDKDEEKITIILEFRKRFKSHEK